MLKLPLQLLSDEHTPAITLMALLVKKYGADILSWEPEVVRWQIEDDYNYRISDLQSDKIQAATALMVTNTFQTYWSAFERICHLLNNTPVDLTDLIPLQAEEIAEALAHARIFFGESDPEDWKFHDDIRAYVGIAFHNYGMFRAPQIFKEAILPKSAEEVEEINREKDDNLKAIYDAKTESIKKSLNELGTNSI